MRRKKGIYDIETLSIDGVSDKERFYRKIMQKMCSKSESQTTFIILVNNPKQPLHARNYFNKDILKEDYQKDLQKVTSFFC